MTKIGVFLSTFNPIHNGDIFVVDKLQSEYNLDNILLVPSNIVMNRCEELPPIKFRREMCKLTCKNYSNIMVYYTQHDGNFCVFDLVQELKRKYSDAKLYLIVELDLFLSFELWYKYEEIFNSVYIVGLAFSKYDYELIRKKAENYEKKVLIKMFEHGYISSEFIRIKYAQGLKCSNYLCDAVEQYIQKNNIYFGNDLLFKECFNASKNRLSFERFNHCQMVAKAAKELAIIYNEDDKRAEIAGILHDIVKEENNKYLLHIMGEYGVNLSEVEKNTPQIWHAIVGALYCEKYLGIEDRQIINSIKYHTTARRDMTMFEKIIYMADCVSDDREHKEVKMERELVKEDLDKALLFQLKRSIGLLCDRERLIHPNTFECYNQLCQKKFI